MERQIQVLVFTADVRVQVPPRPPKKAPKSFDFGAFSYFLTMVIYIASALINKVNVVRWNHFLQ